MTNLRAPLTFEQAMSRIVGGLGREGAATAIGKSKSLFQKLSNPSHSTRLTYEDALKLDTAYVAAGGEGAPLHDCYALRLRAEVRRETASSIALATKVAKVAAEAGEATSALILAAQPGATQADHALALRETEQLIAACTATLPHTAAGARTGFAPGRK